MVVVNDDGCVPSPATSRDSDIGGLPRPRKGGSAIGACGICVYEGLIEILSPEVLQFAMMDSVLIIRANTDPANKTRRVAIKGNFRKEILLRSIRHES